MPENEQCDINPPDHTNLSNLNLNIALVDSKVNLNKSHNSLSRSLSRFANDVRFETSQHSITPSIDQGCVGPTQVQAPNSTDFRNQPSQAPGPSLPRDSSGGAKGSKTANHALNNYRTANLPNYQKHQNILENKPVAFNLETEKLSQMLASDIVNRLGTGSIEGIKLLIENGLMGLFDSVGTRKRSAGDASLVGASDQKRKRVTCEYCPKTMVRQCDLK